MTPPRGNPARLSACAKLNLYLHVTGLRDDGYHLLDSLIGFVDLKDVLELRLADDLALVVDGPFAADVGPADENLVQRAARALSDAAGVAAMARMRLVKNIPVAAGLGGGSADAAAALRGLVRLWNIDPRAIDLHSIALRLGTDVPVCLDGRPAFVGGVGERIDPAPPPPEAGLLLVNPRVSVPTQRVFASRRGGFSSSARFTGMPATARGLAEVLAARANDLTAAAKSLAPGIGEVLAALGGLPDCLLARMSGSGATCFGLFDDQAGARRAQAVLASRHDWWTFAGRLMTGSCR